MSAAALEEGVAQSAAAADDDDADVQSRIDGFRDSRQTRELRAAVGVFVVGMLASAVGLYFGNLSKHIGLPPIYWPVGFGFSLLGNGIAYTITEALDFERGFGEISLAQLRDPQGRIWLPALLALWFNLAQTMPTMYSKYGPVYITNYLFVGLYCFASLVVALSKGEINIFSPAVTATPVWRRRATICEWLAAMYGIGMWIYVYIYLDLWYRGQWEGALLGADASCLLMVLVHSALAARYCKVWATRGFDLPGRPVPEGYLFQRRQLVANLPWQFGIHSGLAFMVWGVLAPHTPQLLRGNNMGLLENLGLWADDLEASPRYSEGYVIGLTGVVFTIISTVLFYGRQQIWRAASSPFVTKQRLADGAFIAALLLQGSEQRVAEEGREEGHSADEKQVDLISEATDLVRRVSMSKITLRMLGASPRDEHYDASSAFALGEDCGLGGIDFFVSHSWSDCPRQKYSQLCAIALLFRQKHGRDPTFWLDKVCIDQKNIARTLRCLPVFEQACSELLIIFGDTYSTRLWCVWELYVHFAMSGLSAAGRTVIVDARSQALVATDDEAEGNDATSGGSGKASAATELSTFDVKDAHCFAPEDEARLRRVIESEGADTFNANIRTASTELRSSSSSSASLSAEQIKGQFVALDSNSDGRLCRHDLLKAFGWDNQQQQAEQLAARGAQVDDLLEILNTGEEVRVNGSRSIGAGEFEAWLSRAT